MDLLAEKAPWMSPYAYCSDNPINRIDPDGKDDIFNLQGQFIQHINNATNNILIQEGNNNNNLVSYTYSSENTANRRMLSNVSTYYARFAGINQKIGVTDVNIKNVGAAFASTNSNTLKVSMDVNQNGKINPLAGNSFNVINSFSHEANHVVNPSDMGTPKGEINAITAQASHSSFGRTTENFQAAALNYAVSNLNAKLKGGSANKVQAQIQNLNSLFSGVGTLIYDIKSRTVSVTYDYLKEVQCTAPVINK